jgi:hypothetical protein
MRSNISAWLIAVFLAAGATAHADSVVCKDGTSAVAGRGACSHHGGVVQHGERTRATKRTHEQARTLEPRRHREARPRPRETHWDDKWLEPRERRGDDWVTRGERTHPIEKREAGTPTAMCNDGQTSYALNHRGACAGHGGVARWLD